MGIHVIGLELDHDGLIPESLEAAIQKLIQNGEKMPKYVIFFVPHNFTLKLKAMYYLVLII